MAIVINGSGTVTGLAVGGLPDGTVDSGTIATGTIVDADVANLAASKLTGALPAISGASLTSIPAASDAEVRTGTSTIKAVTPANVNATQLGWGQSWTEVTASRSASTNYTNSTGQPIFINITAATNNSYDGNLWIDSVKVGNYYTRSNSTAKTNISAVVPNGSIYQYTCTIGFGVWSELR